MTDPIADFIIRIKNAFMARKHVVHAPYSKMKHSLADILVTEGYLESSSIDSSGQFPELVVKLAYVNRVPAITDVRRVSKPGRRVYAAVNEIPKTLGGYGTTVLSTSKGVVTGTTARKLGVGGEVLFQVW